MEYFVDVKKAAAFLPDKMCKTNLFDSPRMFCDVYGFEPGQSQKMHVHDGSDKVYYVVEGSGVFQVGEEERLVARGSAVFAPAGAGHAVRNAGDGRLVVLVFMAPKP
ncbi:MAG: cupin domain-containing protein [Candidatus Binatia bacterium]|nr:cupin domain-containing protein [Candidatus Binatia bacterium]